MKGCFRPAVTDAMPALNSTENVQLSEEEAEQLAADSFADLWFTEDHREAEAAFAEKRDPKFRGK